MKCSELQVGKKAKIKKIDLDEKKQIKLFHLGVIPGEDIICKFKSPFHTPIAYQIKGCVFAIREEDAALIEVEHEK